MLETINPIFDNWLIQGVGDLVAVGLIALKIFGISYLVYQFLKLVFKSKK